MSAVFLKLLNMSIAAGWLVVAVIVLRLCLKKAPKAIHCALWALVAFRLLCPFSLESNFSLIPEEVANGNAVSEWTDDYIGDIDIHHPSSVYYDAAIGAGREPISDGEGGYYVVTKHDQLSEPATIENTVVPVLSWIWIAGVAALLLYAAVSYIRIRSRVKVSLSWRDNIWRSEQVDSPFILGVFRPQIYLPFGVDEVQMNHVVAHEQAHLSRRDHWWKPLGFILLAVYWFNPLMWVAYILLCRDIELACDEKVIRDMGAQDKKAYSEALLACSVPRRMIAACPVSFGEVGVKKRIASVLHYKKPAFWILIVALIAAAVIAVCFLTNPKNYAEMIRVNGTIYLRQEQDVDTLPVGSYEIGELRSILHRTQKEPEEEYSAVNLDEKYAGNKLYQSGFYTIYLEDLRGFYIPFSAKHVSDTALREQYHKERSEYIFERFNMNPADYCYARDNDAIYYLDTGPYFFIRETIDVPPKSTTPSFFVTEDAAIVYVVFQDNTALNHLYKFTLSEGSDPYTVEHSSIQDVGSYQEVFESFNEYEERVGIDGLNTDSDVLKPYTRLQDTLDIGLGESRAILKILDNHNITINDIGLSEDQYSLEEGFNAYTVLDGRGEIFTIIMHHSNFTALLDNNFHLVEGIIDFPFTEPSASDYCERFDSFQFDVNMEVNARDFVNKVYGVDCSKANAHAYGYANRVSVQLDVEEDMIFQVHFYYLEPEPIEGAYFTDSNRAEAAMEEREAVRLYSHILSK